MPDTPSSFRHPRWRSPAPALDRIAPLFRTAAAWALVVLASVWVVLACGYPNIDLLLPPGRGDRATAYLNLVFAGSAVARSSSVVHARCAGADVIPPGSRVAVAQGFFLPHAVVGPKLDRVLVQPPAAARDAHALLAELQASDAGWLVTRRGSDLDQADGHAQCPQAPRPDLRRRQSLGGGGDDVVSAQRCCFTSKGLLSASRPRGAQMGSGVIVKPAAAATCEARLETSSSLSSSQYPSLAVRTRN